MKLLNKKRYIEDRKWFRFYPKWDRNHTTISESQYFDPRPTIHIQLTTVLSLLLIPFLGWYSLILLPFIFYGWGDMYISLPLDSGIEDSADYKEFGFYFYGEPKFNIECLVIQMGRDEGGIYIYMPWSLKWYRTSALRKDGEWEHEIGKHNKEFYNTEKWKDILFYETHPYTYTTSYNEKQNALATIRVTEREWRRRCLFNFTLLNRVTRSINVEFSEDIGEKKGSWKGGTVGCSYELLPNESPFECLKRMERERVFK